MKIGEIIEHLKEIRDRRDLNYYTEQENEAITAACSILDKFPKMAEAAEYEEFLGEINTKL